MQSVERTLYGRPAEANTPMERRKALRFEVEDGVCVSPLLSVVGRIENISEDGLAFQYAADRTRSRESSRLAISLADNTFNLGMISFDVVWDEARPGPLSPGAVSLRHCGVQFGDLADYQKLGLQFFIRNYTVAFAEA